MPALSAADDESASGIRSSTGQKPQQQTPMQADARSVLAAGHQPPCASIQAAQQHTPASQEHIDPAQPHQHSTGRADCADQEQSMGSPGMPARAQEQDPPSSAKAPATLQPCPQITAGPAGRALQSSPWKVKPWRAAQPRLQVPLASWAAALPCRARPGMEAAAAAPPCARLLRSACPLLFPGTAHLRGYRKPEQYGPHQDLVHPPVMQRCRCPAGGTAGRANTGGKVQLSLSRGPPEPEAVLPSQGCKEIPHPKPKKGKSIHRPDWSKDSPKGALAWLMYQKVLHSGRGGGGADFQTMSLELPTDTLKKKRPKFGDKTFLQIETRPEDDISNIPFMARVANHQVQKLH